MIILNKSISCKTLRTTLQEAYKNLARGFQGGDNLARRKKTCKKNFQNSCKFIHLTISCNILHILQDFLAILQDDFYWDTRASTSAMKEIIMSTFSDTKSILRVLIATTAFSMGIDLPDIHQIFHFGAPCNTYKR